MRHDSESFDEACFDRLVDGEVGSAEYQRLLAAMDERPDRWRRLALAFLEAQAWQHELVALQCDTDVKPGPTLAATPRSAKWAPVCVTAAACFLLAFCLGVYWNSDSTQPNHGPSADIASQGSAPEPELGAVQADPWGRMTVVWDRSDGRAQEFDLPIFRWRDTQSRPEFFADTMQVPGDVQQALERAGYAVRRNIQWTPLDVDDGRRVFVPMGEMEIIPVVNRAY